MIVGECEHHQVNISNTITPVITADGVKHGWTMILQIHCTACGTPMRIQGQFKLPPLTPDEARRGPWTDFGQQQLGFMFTAMTPEDAAFEVQGTA